MAKVVILRKSYKGTFELGVVYSERKQREVEVNYSMFVDTGRGLDKVAQRFTEVFRKHSRTGQMLKGVKGDGKKEDRKAVKKRNKEFKKYFKGLESELEHVVDELQFNVLGDFGFLMTGDFKGEVRHKVVEVVDQISKKLTKIWTKRGIQSVQVMVEQMEQIKIILVSVLTAYTAGITKGKKIEEILVTVLHPYCLMKYCEPEEIIILIKQEFEDFRHKILSENEDSQLSRNITYLMIQPELSNFPFEFLEVNPCDLDANPDRTQYFLRMPNFDVISNYLENDTRRTHPMLKNLEKWYYCVNPQGD